MGSVGIRGLVAAGALALLCMPVAAHGAPVTIGEAFPPQAGGSQNVTNLQTTSPGGQYAAPAAGVITSWSHFAGPNPAELPDQIKLKVSRPAALNTYLGVGDSALQTPSLGVLNTFPTNIPVQAGDVIGFWFLNGGANAAAGRAAPGYSIHYTAGDSPVGAASAFTAFPNPTQLDISATLETAPCAGKPPTIVGTPGNDSLTGTAGADVIVALEGNDVVDGLGANDLLCGGAGRDTLRGGPGKDTLLGEAGKDALKGGGGKDVCKGGPARDSAAGSCEKSKSI